MTWQTDTDICGERVVMYMPDGEELAGVVVGEGKNVIRVKGDDGETYIGNQFDPE